MPVTALGADSTIVAATRQRLGDRFANDLAVALLGQVQAVLLVLDRDQPFEPFVEVGNLILARFVGMVVVRLSEAVQLVRAVLTIHPAHDAFLLIVLPADSLPHWNAVAKIVRDQEGQSFLHRLGAAFLQEAGPGDLTLRSTNPPATSATVCRSSQARSHAPGRTSRGSCPPSRWQPWERCELAFLQRLDSSQTIPAGNGWPGFHSSTQRVRPS